jgi:demethylmenaquinone methyltransferase/2-methoxy-6-polyprenyl-1,4-benzoquinol methylase
MNKSQNIKKMFSSIAGRYDLLNRLMSFGRDMHWRRYLVTKALIPDGGRVLDVGIGTGDIAFEILKLYPLTKVTGVDLTIEMMEVGQKKAGDRKIEWCLADARGLPFSDNTFDAVVSGFLARNVFNLSMAFKEQIRVTRQGGRVLCLDTSPVPNNILKPLTLFYLNKVIPFMGHKIAGEGKAYTLYLPSQINHEFYSA